MRQRSRRRTRTDGFGEGGRRSMLRESRGRRGGGGRADSRGRGHHGNVRQAVELRGVEVEGEAGRRLLHVGRRERELQRQRMRHMLRLGEGRRRGRLREVGRGVGDSVRRRKGHHISRLMLRRVRAKRNTAHRIELGTVLHALVEGDLGRGRCSWSSAIV